ncbi:MAG: LuxR C-terminal-related transcriptional regulator [bacterium]|nr:LuxR C-terminal-related transcriptional regulator [bacterium]
MKKNGNFYLQNMNNNDILSKQDAICLLDLINESLFCAKEKEFRILLDKLKNLLNFEYAVSASINLDKKGLIESYELVNLNYPAQWMEAYVEKRYDLIDPIVIENITKYNVQYWNDTYKKHNAPKKFVNTAKDVGLKEGYTYGLKNLEGTHGTIFSFSGPKYKQQLRTEYILKYVIPHLHQALIRFLKPNMKLNADKDDVLLSSREKEILNWVKYGKSSWEISVILHISERTVNFHVTNIMHKLDVVKRSQAVAVAIDQGYIQI